MADRRIGAMFRWPRRDGQVTQGRRQCSQPISRGSKPTLRKTVGSDRIRIVAPTSHGGSIEVWAGSEFLGTLHRDDEDGDVSYSVQISILEEDLPEAAPQSAAPTRRR